MIYLDYSATTPVSYDVLESYIRATRDFPGNANSIHGLGTKSKALMNASIKQIAETFGVMEDELTFTSSATEANNFALIGVALANERKGKHIIVSQLEHPGIYAICNYLETQGFIVDYVKNTSDGLVDFDDLKRLIKEDTILVSIASVNSETGVRQPLKMIRQVIRKGNPNTIFHSDMTQALGKVPVNLHDVDLATFSAHKIYGPKGIGLLYASNRVSIKPLLYGSGKSNMLNPGTPPLPLIVSFAKAIRLCVNDLDKRESFIKRLNDRLIENLSTYENVMINHSKMCIPHILNISLKGIKAETFLHALEEYDIYISTNTACSSGNFSTSIMALYNDRERASSTLRISLSYLTTTDEITRFIDAFAEVYKRLSLN